MSVSCLVEQKVNEFEVIGVGEIDQLTHLTSRVHCVVVVVLTCVCVCVVYTVVYTVVYSRCLHRCLHPLRVG